jgi:AraC-like DNA-binding protein
MPETRSLLSTSQVILGLSVCGAVGRGMSEEEVESRFTVVFPMRGVFVHHAHGRRTTASPAVALFLDRGQIHQMSHPAGGGDQSFFIAYNTRLVEPFLDLSVSAFPRRVATTSPTMFLTMRAVARRVGSGHLEDLAAEELAVGALDTLLGDPDISEPSTTQRNLIADAEEYLSSHFRDKSDLITIGRQIGVSPHHLSRLFRRITGVTLSARRTQLRLRSAIDQLLDGAEDISEIAIESGFYDHSHLTNTMQAKLGTTPSQIRDEGGFPLPRW